MFSATCPIGIHEIEGVYRPIEKDVFEYEEVLE